VEVVWIYCCLLAWSTASTATHALLCLQPRRTARQEHHRCKSKPFLQKWRRSELPLDMAIDAPAPTTTTTTKRRISDTTKACFRDKTILITGASSGLGRSLVIQLARHCGPCQLILTGRNEARLEQVAQECRQATAAAEAEAATVKTIAADLANPQEVQHLADNVLRETAHVLIHSAGVSSRDNFVDTCLEVDRQVLQINFWAGVALAKALVPSMIMAHDNNDNNYSKNNKQKKNGMILWISGIQGLVGVPQRTSNVASKFAIQGYCESLRGELVSSGVTVHTVSPGYMNTDLSRSAIRGNGMIYGQVDNTTATGACPHEVAVEILNKVAKGKLDFTVAAGFSATLAVYLRLLCPPLLRALLVKRFEKGKSNKT